MKKGQKIMGKQKDKIYSLIPLEDFKAVIGIDDREEKLTQFCLLTATYTIEQYCMRRLLKKQHFEVVEFFGDLLLPLREYPIISMKNEKLEMSNGNLIEPEFYRVIPDLGTDLDIPFSIELSPVIARLGCKKIKVVYFAGYSSGNVPADLAAACMELAVWNMNRYKGRRVGMTGNVRGTGKEGEHFEMSIPENVKVLLEPYRRKVF